MTDIAVWLAWFGALAWPALLAFGLWRGLKAGRGPGWMAWSVIGIVTIAWALGIRAFLWEPATLEVRRVEVTSRSWSGTPLRIGVISDTHTDGPHVGISRLESIIARMNAERPDVVVLLGDFVGGHGQASERGAGERREIAEGLAAFSKLKAPLGVWSVLGNHDWWYDGAAVESGLVTAGVQVLENSRARIPREGGAFWIGGLADYESRRAQPSYTDTLNGIAPDEPVIVMSHWPDPFAVAPERVALTLAGHSHCGQVNLPVVGRPIAVSPGAERWPCGLYEDRGGWLYVSGGVGTSVLPVRFGKPPEIAVLTLRGF
jgi:predicted MPP superfamily phosphohydrolase